MIKFIKILASEYAALKTAGTVNADYFYLLTDTNELFLGERHLTDQDLSDYLTSVSAKDNSIVVSNNSQIGVKISSKAGNNITLETESGKEGLYVNVPAATDYTVGITETSGGSSDPYSKRYNVVQSATGLDVNIDIPKDMVVESGSVVDITYSEGHLYDGSTDVTEKIKGQGGTATAADAGKYIKLEIANSASDVLYIAAKDLVDIYTAQSSASEVQLSISNSNVISASLVNGGITTAKIADDAVTTDKLADSIVTSLGKADSAVQSVSEGSTNGTIDVDGTDVSVHGLGTAAFTNSSAYATAAQGAKADTAVQSVTATGTTGNDGTITVDGSEVAVKGLKSAAFTESSAYATAAQGALADSAVQSVAEGTSNGTIKVDGTDISVHGLGTAAYASSSDFDAAGSANAVKGNSGDAASAATVYGAKAYADSLSSNYDAAGSAASAEAAAKTYAEGLVSWETYSAE